MKFYPLQVKDVRPETAECVSISFVVPGELSDTFAWQPGQYLTLRTTIDGEEVRRSYSICSAPADRELRVAVKRIEEGKFSTWANHQLQSGDTLDVMPPLGHFYTELKPTQSQSYVFFAAGSGITPVISNIKAILHTEPNSQCTLIYGNRHVSAIIFKEAIEALKNQYLGRLRLFNVLSRERVEVELLHGRLDHNKIELFLEKIPDLLQADHFFACGPEEMSESVKAILVAKGIAEEKIHVELFNAPKQNGQLRKEIQNAVFSKASITLNGLTFEVPVEKGQNVLDAAQITGADMPYACKGGVCCTCRAKLISGEVEMYANYALTKTEVEQGFILTCQAVPKTPELAVDFDIK